MNVDLLTQRLDAERVEKFNQENVLNSKIQELDTEKQIWEKNCTAKDLEISNLQTNLQSLSSQLVEGWQNFTKLKSDLD